MPAFRRLRLGNELPIADRLRMVRLRRGRVGVLRRQPVRQGRGRTRGKLRHRRGRRVPLERAEHRKPLRHKQKRAVYLPGRRGMRLGSALLLRERQRHHGLDLHDGNLPHPPMPERTAHARHDLQSAKQLGRGELRVSDRGVLLWDERLVLPVAAYRNRRAPVERRERDEAVRARVPSCGCVNDPNSSPPSSMRPLPSRSRASQGVSDETQSVGTVAAWPKRSKEPLARVKPTRS